MNLRSGKDFARIRYRQNGKKNGGEIIFENARSKDREDVNTNDETR